MTPAGSRRGRDVTFAVASIAFGAMWLFAAGAKVMSPLPAYEFLTRALPAGLAAKAVLVAGVTAESLLGAAMLLRAIRAAPAFAMSLAGLAAACALLLDVRSKASGILQCGCYGHVFYSTIDGELVFDAAMAAVLVALLAWGFRGRASSASTSSPPTRG